MSEVEIGGQAISWTVASRFTLQICTHSDRARWNEFVATQRSGSFYHKFEWGPLNRAELGGQPYYLAAFEEGNLVGVLPLTFVSSRLFGRILCSMPYVNYGGPCALSAEAAGALVDGAITLADGLKSDYLELRCREPIPRSLPVSLDKISMTLELEPDPERVWSKFSSKHRTSIRRAEKNGLTVRSGGRELLPEFYSTMELSWRALGTPLYRRAYFERIMATFPDETRIFVASAGGEPVGVAFNGYFGDTVEGMWAGGGPRARELQVNYVLYWEMIRDACERGYRRYHLGRSTADSGAEDFKKKWNAAKEQLHWFYYRPSGGSELPALNVRNARFRAAISAWRRLPLWATRAIGPHIARAIP